MSLGRTTPTRMDLAAFPLGEVIEVKPGLFRHPSALSERLARLFGLRPARKPEGPFK